MRLMNMARTKLAKKLTVALAGMMLTGLTGAAISAQGGTAVVDQTDNGGMIDWTNGFVFATGYGPKQDGIPATRQRALQRRVAIVDAQRLLAETIEGVHVTSETTVRNYQLESDVIRTKVDAFLKNFFIVKEEYNAAEETYQVTLAVAMTPGAATRAGVDTSLSDIIVPEVEVIEPQIVEVPETPDPDIIDIPEVPERPEVPEPPARTGGPYTGVVIDARGYDLKRAMSPKIVMPNGQEVWGTVKVDVEFVRNYGIVSYVPTIDLAMDANVSRAGDNPLVIQAMGRHGNFKANPVISEEDAELLLSEAERTPFLTEFKVVFVVDGGRR